MSEMENDVIDMAGFFIDDEKLLIEYGDDLNPKNITLEFAHIGERLIVEKVLEDRNFWVQIVNALSAALKRQGEAIDAEEKV